MLLNECVAFLFQVKMAESDSDVMEISIDPEDEKKNCEGVCFIIVFSRQNMSELNS
jgi:hypothetical protein